MYTIGKSCFQKQNAFKDFKINNQLLQHCMAQSLIFYRGSGNYKYYPFLRPKNTFVLSLCYVEFARTSDEQYQMSIVRPRQMSMARPIGSPEDIRMSELRRTWIWTLISQTIWAFLRRPYESLCGLLFWTIHRCQNPHQLHFKKTPSKGYFEKAIN